MPTATIEIYWDRPDLELDDEYKVTFEYSCWDEPPRFHGSPDDWCPGDSGHDYDIEKIILNDKEININDLDEDVLEWMHDHVNDWIVDNWPEEDEGPEPDYDDYDEPDYGDYFVPDNYDPYGGP
jgi:hypothetical protein